jgi:hypothetical protein
MLSETFLRLCVFAPFMWIGDIGVELVADEGGSLEVEVFDRLGHLLFAFIFSESEFLRMSLFRYRVSSALFDGKHRLN